MRSYSDTTYLSYYNIYVKSLTSFLGPRRSNSKDTSQYGCILLYFLSLLNCIAFHYGPNAPQAVPFARLLSAGWVVVQSSVRSLLNDVFDDVCVFYCRRIQLSFCGLDLQTPIFLLSHHHLRARLYAGHRFMGQLLA